MSILTAGMWRPAHGIVGAPLTADEALSILAQRNLTVFGYRRYCRVERLIHGCDGQHRLRWRLVAPGIEPEVFEAYLQPGEVARYHEVVALRRRINAAAASVQAAREGATA